MAAILDAIDRQQRVRRLRDALDDVLWLATLYPLDQNTDIYLNVSAAAQGLREALEAAEKEEKRDERG